MSRNRLLTGIVLAVAVLVAGVPASAQDTGPSTLLLILDVSNSMWGQIDGENKIVIARHVLGDLVDGLADGTEVGVIAYGHRREGDCEDIETVVALGRLDKTGLKATVNGLMPKGKTPITASIKRAFAELVADARPATVILISDGLETCGGDPCAAVLAAKDQGIAFIMHVVGFDVAGEDVSQLECAAQAGDGLFISAENAAELADALEQAVALPPEIPAGRLAVKVVADGGLQDAVVVVTNAAGDDFGGGRTYTDPRTNPREIPLPDGKYAVKVQAVGIKGDIIRRFEVDIVEGSRDERVIDFSTGEVVIGVTRNGERSDATYSVSVMETGEEAARGRTYEAANRNPAVVRITAGTYEVSVKSVKIAGGPRQDLGQVIVEPGGRTEVAHDWPTGLLKVGAIRDGQLVDATLRLTNEATGLSVGQGRTYTSDKSNPKGFILPPGTYRVGVGEIRGERREIVVTVGAGEEKVEMVDMEAGGER